MPFARPSKWDVKQRIGLQIRLLLFALCIFYERNALLILYSNHIHVIPYSMYVVLYRQRTSLKRYKTEKTDPKPRRQINLFRCRIATSVLHNFYIGIRKGRNLYHLEAMLSTFISYDLEPILFTFEIIQYNNIIIFTTISPILWYTLRYLFSTN